MATSFLDKKHVGTFTKLKTVVENCSSFIDKNVNTGINGPTADEVSSLKLVIKIQYSKISHYFIISS